VLGTFCGHFLHYFDNFFSNLGASLRCYFFLAWLPLVLHDHDRNEKLNFKKKFLESGAVFFSSIFLCHTKGGDQPQEDLVGLTTRQIENLNPVPPKLLTIS
jgi:hypothetical protein